MSSGLEKRLTKKTLCLPVASPLHMRSTTNLLSSRICGGWQSAGGPDEPSPPSTSN